MSSEHQRYTEAASKEPPSYRGTEPASFQREVTYKELCEDYREYPEDLACEQSSIVLVNYKDITDCILTMVKTV